MRSVHGLKKQLVSCKKYLYFGGGILMVGCGVIGIILPVMPTTIFFILALACFSRSSARMTQWLLNHPKFGRNLSAWAKYQVVPKKAKYWAAGSMAVSLIIVALTTQSIALILLVAYILLLVTIYLFSKPSSIDLATSSQYQPGVFKPWQIAGCSGLLLACLYINCPHLVHMIYV
ncbi:MAG: YbaN family protein [Gammaproteobacteria bacterium]|nr:YbaN family protein [Gammaproteobacteria bacterium]